MCKAMDDWAKEEREIGLKEGHESGLREGQLEERKRFIVRMLKKDKSDEEIIDITECTKEQLEEIKAKI